MQFITQVAILVCLVYFAVADWRNRSISLVTLLFYGTLLLWSSINYYSTAATLPESGINTVFLAVQFALVAAVLKLRNQHLSLKSGIGSGDIVFILLSGLGWATTIFLTAYLIGLVAAVVLAIGMQRGQPAADFPIPLLTALGTTFAFVLIVNWYF